MARLDIFDNIFVEAKSRHCSAGQSAGKLIKKLDQYDDLLIQHDKKSTNESDKKPNKKTTTKNINNTMVMIEEAMNKKITDTDDNILFLDEQMINLENEMETMDKQYHWINNQISISEAHGDMLTNYDEEKKILNKKCRDLVDSINLATAVRSTINKIKNGRTLQEMKCSETERHREKDSKIQDFTARIETNLKMISVIDQELIDDKELNDMRDKLNENQNTIETYTKEKFDLDQKITNIESMRGSWDLIAEKFRAKNEVTEKMEQVAKKQHEINGVINQQQNELQELKTHEFNLECEQCMKNPITKTILMIQQKINRLRNDLEDSEIERKRLENICNNFDTEIDTQYINMKKDIDQIDKLTLASERTDTIIKLTQKDILILKSNIKRMEDALIKIKNNKDIENTVAHLKQQIKQLEVETTSEHGRCVELQLRLTDINKQIKIDLARLNELSTSSLVKSKQYNNHVISIIEMSYMRKRLSLIDKRVKKIKHMININKAKRDDFNSAKIRLEIDMERFREIKEELDTVEKKKIVLGYIKKILDKNGLVDILLSRNIILFLQTSINGIMSEVGHYQVDISYKNQSVNVYKDNGLNICMSSGYESYLLDLVFRLALVQINNHVKTDFLIIDEGFNACDDEHKNNIKELLEYMRSYYKWILIISHDEFIKSFYDVDIRIVSTLTGSRLCNIDRVKSKDPLDSKETNKSIKNKNHVTNDVEHKIVKKIEN